MTILAAALAAVLACPVRAQTPARKDVNRYDVYEHKSSGVTLVVMTPVGQDRPDAVFYAGPKAQWLVTNDELFSLGRDDGWAQIRYDIYNLRAQGLAYKEDSNAMGDSIYNWGDDSAVQMVESVAARLEGKDHKKEAALDCLLKADEWKHKWRAAESTRKSLLASWKVTPGYIKDKGELDALEPKLKDAGDKIDLAKRECDYAISHDALDVKSSTFWLSSLHLREAAAVVAQSENVLQWEPIPSY